MGLLKNKFFIFGFLALFLCATAVTPALAEGGGGGGGDQGQGGDDGNGNDGNGGDGEEGDGLLDDDREALDNFFSNDHGNINYGDSVINEQATQNLSNCPDNAPRAINVPVVHNHDTGFWPGALTCPLVETTTTSFITDDQGNQISVVRTECGYRCQNAPYHRVNSCFTPDTLILMGDKTQRRVDELKDGDLVWNPALNKAQAIKARIAGPEKKPMYEIGYGDYSVKVTEGHPMLIQKREAAGIAPVALSNASESKTQVVRAMDITEQDRILGADGKFHQVKTLKVLPLDPHQQVWNFELEADSDDLAHHMIVANGIITGDVRVQANLNSYTLPWDKKSE